MQEHWIIYSFPVVTQHIVLVLCKFQFKSRRERWVFRKFYPYKLLCFVFRRTFVSASKTRFSLSVNVGLDQWQYLKFVTTRVVCHDHETNCAWKINKNSTQAEISVKNRKKLRTIHANLLVNLITLINLSR